MSREFTRDHCKIALGKILQTIGWHSINTTPLEVLTDILSSYISQIAKLTNDYANEFGQTEPNLDHLGLAFQELGVNLGDLEEYVTYVNFVPPAQPVPKYPLQKESNLNFLKPGSKEVVTRPVHINEHLPPMYPLLEEQNDQPDVVTSIKEEPEPKLDSHQFKKPADVSPDFKRLKREDEGGRPTREISSVMMTTSGFLSPAREGKLPEAKAPAPPPEPPKPPSPGPPVPELVPVSKKKPEKKKEKISKELHKSFSDEKPSKKINNMKDILRMKRASAVAANAAAAAAAASSIPGMLPPGLRMQPVHPKQSFMPPFPAPDMKMPPLIAHSPKPQVVRPSNFNRALAAAKAKTEKLNTTITPIPIKSEPKFQPIHQQVDKLVAEPDRKKINILKKISNVKDKHEKAKSNANSQLMQQTHDIVNKINLSSDITIEPIHPSVSVHHNTVPKREPYFDDGSPPGTPPTPRTPEFVTHSPPFAAKEKRKRKEKPDKPPKPKKPRKQQHFPHAHFLEPDMLDMAMGRPKTPDVFRKNPAFQPLHVPPTPAMPPFPFSIASFGGPGLIPSLPFPFAPPIPDFAGFQAIPPKPEPIVPKVSPKPKEVVKPEPAEVVPLPSTPTSSRHLSPPPPEPPAVKSEKEDHNLPSDEAPKKSKEHKKDKKEKDKTKKKNKKEKVKDKAEKKKLKEAKKEKLKMKKEKKKKLPKTEEAVPMTEAAPAIPKILLKVNSPSPRPETPDSAKKLNIKPVVRRESPSPERKPREPSPGLAQISALVIGPPKHKNATAPSSPSSEKLSPAAESSPTTPTTPRPPGRPRIHPVKQKPVSKPKKLEQPFKKVDSEGNEVWICPACGQQDDGRPMIGCDGCDAWYHWVCVGIQVPPDENENWYCKPCLAKKNEDLQDKKKKRKKKEKVH